MRSNPFRTVPGALSLALILGFISVRSGVGQSLPVPALVTAPISGNARVTLHGNVSPLIQGGRDLGPAPAFLRTDRLMLVLKRSQEQDTSLAAYLKDVQSSSSAQYHKFVSPEEFGARFGISDGDLATVEQWLEKQGFAVAGVNKGRTVIEFSGTVGQVEATFQTPIHRFNVAGVEHLANTADPQIPSALAPVIGGVTFLNDFKPVSNIVKGPSGNWDAKSERFTPDLTVTSGGNQYLLLGPGDAATIYDSPNSFNTHFASGQTIYDGTGVTIGVAGTTLLGPSADSFYRFVFGLGSQGAITIYDGNQSNFDPDADETEAIADVEIAGGVAPGATVLYYGAGDTAFQSGLFLAINRAIDDNKVNILNVSYGECEAELGASGNLEVLNAWEQAAAQGITVVVASGDSGSAGCDNQNTEAAASHGFGVNGLASTPYNIAVGGTDFDTLGSNFSKYVQTSGSGLTTALSYIPENPWNDSTKTNSALSSNTPLLNSSGQTTIWAGGGGASNAVNGSSGYAKPEWQSGYSPSNTDSARDIPDVSLFSGGLHYNAAWALCESNDCTSNTNFSIHAVGGTSTAAPAFAGILALVNQKMGASSRLGQANWVLYKLAQTDPSIFHSITVGNNAVYCAAGSPNCGGNQFMTGYNAGTGYNLATGLGSVDASLLVDHWGDDSRAATTTSLSLASTTFQHGTPVTFTAGVNPASATGDIAITDNYASQAQANSGGPTTYLRLNGGSASGTFSQLPGGSYDVYANYAGDGNYAGSVSQQVAVTVTPENSSLQFTASYVNSQGQLVNAAGAAVPLGSLISFNAIPIGVSQSGSAHPIADATGTVSFSDLATGYTYPWNQQATLDSTGTAEANADYLQGGPHEVAASYSGDLSYNASTASAIAFTVSPAATTISISASATSTIQDPVSIRAQISAPLPANVPLSPSGKVTFTDTTSNTVLGSTTYTGVGGCTGNSTYCFAAILQVNSTQLQAGANSIIASFSGDNNFNASGNSAAVTVTCLASCWNAAGQRLELSFYASTPSGPLSAGQSSTTPVSVMQSGGFAGDVNLTCSVTGKNANDQHIPTCSFNPATVTITSNQAVQSTLTINTTGSSSGAVSPQTGPHLPLGTEAVAFCSLILFFVPKRRFPRHMFVALLALLLGLGALSACGGGGASSGGGTGGGGTGGGGGGTTSGTTPDTYTVTFRAADVATGTVTAQDYFNVIVN